MRDESGTYSVTADELREFEESGRQHWYMNEDGTTMCLDLPPVLDGTLHWPMWIAQRPPPHRWARINGDYEQAATSLSQTFAESIERLKAEGRWPPMSPS